MNRFLSPIIPAALICASLPSLSMPAGQMPDKTAIKILYTRLSNAMKMKDVRAIQSLGTPDFTNKLRDGKVYNAKDSLAEMEKGFRSMKRITDIKINIRSLTINGKKAVAVVDHNMSAVIVMQSKPADMTMKSSSKDTLVKTPQGWKFKSVVSLSEEMTINGQKIGTAPPAKRG